MNGKQLKNSILQWAIQGKLVPQDPNDEPASVLLERIRAEKAKLIKEKKIKKDKNESIIYRGEDNSYYEKLLATGDVKCIDDEIPFDIPQGWEWARFSTIINMSPTVSAEDDTDAAFMPMALINAGYGSGYSYETRKWSLIKTGFTKLAVGDIAFAKITPCFQNRKSFILADVPGKVAAATTELNVLRLYEQTLYAWYVLYFLKSDYFIKEAKYKGTAGQQRVLSSYVQNKLFPIPPYNEQYRIIEKIQKVFTIVDKYEKSQKGLDELNALIFDKLMKSILQEAIQGKLVPQIEEEGTAQELLEQIRKEKQKLVKDGKLKKSTLTDSVIYKGDDNKYYEQVGNEKIDITEEIPFDLPDNWTWCRLGNLISITSGENLTSKQMGNGKIPVYGGNGITGYHSKANVFEETIVIGRVGYYCGSIHLTPCQAWVTDNAFITQYSKLLNRDFLIILLTALNLGKCYNATAQPVVSGKKIYPLLIALPPIKEQQRIVAQIEKLFEQLR